MKFVHIADMHFDRPFINLSDREYFGDLKRLEQRKVFKNVIEYVKNNNIKYLFIAGDFYEHDYVKKTTIEYINNLFKEIPETKIFITPGNHDPFIKNSYYNKYIWNDNVKIFNSNIEKIETEEANIYGFGFNDFYCTNSGLESFEINQTDKSKLNILIIHGTVDGATLEEKEYNSMKSKVLNEKGFDYIALGHIHKLDYNSYENQKIVYPGSTTALGFDETGKHGMIVGEINKNDLKVEFIPIEQTEFEIKEIDITDIFSKEELIEKINELNIEKNNYLEIYLVGKRNFEINNSELLKLIENEKIIKIKNKTQINYNLEKIANENTLKGIFVKKMLKKLNETQNSDEKEILEKSIEIGIDSLK